MEEVYQLHAWDWDAHLKKEQILELTKTVDDVGHRFETPLKGLQFNRFRT
jgi:hypothetical protein